MRLATTSGPALRHVHPNIDYWRNVALPCVVNELLLFEEDDTNDYDGPEGGEYNNTMANKSSDRGSMA